MKDFIVCLDFGHGGKDVGAVDKIGDDAIYKDKYYTEESRLVLKVGLKLKKKLEEKTNYKVILTRKDDNYLKLSTRTQIANRANADIFVSLHANAFFKASVSGIETLFYPTSKLGRKLATELQIEMIENTDAVDRGIRERDDLYVLKHTDMPAALVELGFITNTREEEFLQSENYQNILINSIIDGINSYYESTK